MTPQVYTAIPTFGSTTGKTITIWTRLRFALQLLKQRRDLAGLTADQRRDIGITAEQAQKEAARPAWDLPANW